MLAFPNGVDIHLFVIIVFIWQSTTEQEHTIKNTHIYLISKKF